MECYLRSLASIRRRTVSRAELDRVFYRTWQRTVRNDCTVNNVRVALSRWIANANGSRFR